MESEVACFICLLQRVHKLASEDFLQHADGQKESRLRRKPSFAVRSQTSGRNYAVDMRMMLQLLIPGVKNTEEPDIGAEVLWVAGDFAECGSGGPEEQVVNNLPYSAEPEEPAHEGW